MRGVQFCKQLSPSCDVTSGGCLGHGVGRIPRWGRHTEQIMPGGSTLEPSSTHCRIQSGRPGKPEETGGRHPLGLEGFRRATDKKEGDTCMPGGERANCLQPSAHPGCTRVPAEHPELGIQRNEIQVPEHQSWSKGLHRTGSRQREQQRQENPSEHTAAGDWAEAGRGQLLKALS